jgi:PAS domain S-box-containing protein
MDFLTYKRISVITGFILLLAVLVGNAIVMRRQLGIQTGRGDSVLHSRQVLFELEQVESLLKDAETGQRGFLYTGDQKYLAPYQSAVSQIKPHLANLEQLTADDPAQQTRINMLRFRSTEKLDELAQTISLFQSGKQDEARTLVLSDIGLSYMNDIRSIIAQMEEEESSLENVRETGYRRSARGMIWSIYLASGLAVCGLVMLAGYIIREMNLREKHALDIKTREEWFRITLTCIGDAVIATDRHGKVTFMNPVAELLTGISLAKVKGTDIQEVFPIFNEYTEKPAENPVSKVVNLGRIVELANHTVLRNANGTLTPIEDSAAPIRDDRNELIGVVLVFRDVSKERQSQEIMRKTEKLAAAARLAATVAHEINNPLEAVVNLVYIAKASPGTPSIVVEHLTLAEQELERVAHITRQTLGFYRESNRPELVDIPAIIDQVLVLFSNKLNVNNITVERDFETCKPIHGMPGELKQVLSNLISNAAEAASRNGTIRIAVRCIEEPQGEAVQIVIEDDGPGIAKEHINRIFEPFFTTKKDVGTGLGLWVTKEIIDRHGGSIAVQPGNRSEQRGAAFTIQLPLTTNGAHGDQQKQQNG